MNHNIGSLITQRREIIIQVLIHSRFQENNEMIYITYFGFHYFSFHFQKHTEFVHLMLYVRAEKDVLVAPALSGPLPLCLPHTLTALVPQSIQMKLL